MSVHSSQKSSTTTYRTLKVQTPEPVTNTVISAGPVSPLPYAMNGSYETVRYLVPMQQAVQPAMQQQYVLMQQPVMQHIQQPVMQQMVSPIYLQNVPNLSVSSQDSEHMYHRHVLEVSP